jgi:putative acyl-CoA dehydrogenase
MYQSSFYQDEPKFNHPFENKLLTDYLSRFIDKNDKDIIFKDLKRFSDRIGDEIEPLAKEAEKNIPKHIAYTPWGKRIDEIEVHPSWTKLEKIASEENLIGIGYERKFGKNSRLYQMAKLFLFHPSSSYFSCPLAMTDGAAKLIELYGDQNLKNKAFKNLTSHNPETFWTSGQWMTEKTGGSDVGLSETRAYKKGDEYHLYGVKWFTSATTSQMAMTLARVVDENGNVIEGSKGLGLFYLELRDSNNQLNNIEILRLKDKMGTKALPTAELKLNGTKAKLIGETGEGIKKIASLFNITRIYNSCCATAAYYRVLDMAINYSRNRYAFKKNIIDHPLHFKKLSELKVKFHACFHLTFFLSRLLGESEQSPNKESEKVLRLLTPIAKLTTAKLNMVGTSELIECFGGAGTIEDTGLPKWLRDAQILTIWEGTTNVLSLDALRAISRDQAFLPYIEKMKSILQNVIDSEQKTLLIDKCEHLMLFMNQLSGLDHASIEFIADDLSFTIAKVTSAILMLEHASHYSNETAYRDIACEYIEQPWPSLDINDDLNSKMKRAQSILN